MPLPVPGPFTPEWLCRLRSRQGYRVWARAWARFRGRLIILVQIIGFWLATDGLQNGLHWMQKSCHKLVVIFGLHDGALLALLLSEHLIRKQLELQSFDPVF